MDRGDRSSSNFGDMIHEQQQRMFIDETPVEKREIAHIEATEEKMGKSEEDSERIAHATVNKRKKRKNSGKGSSDASKVNLLVHQLKKKGMKVTTSKGKMSKKSKKKRSK